MKRQLKPACPRNEQICLIIPGGGRSAMSSTFSLSTSIPLLEMIWPITKSSCTWCGSSPNSKSNLSICIVEEPMRGCGDTVQMWAQRQRSHPCIPSNSISTISVHQKMRWLLKSPLGVWLIKWWFWLNDDFKSHLIFWWILNRHLIY
jgi:hypothetical protein